MHFIASALFLLQASGAFAAIAFQHGWDRDEQAVLQGAITNARTVITQGYQQTRPGAQLDPRIEALIDSTAPPPPGSNRMTVQAKLQARYTAALAWYSRPEYTVTFTHTPSRDRDGSLLFPFTNRRTGRVEYQRVAPLPRGVNAITVHADPTMYATDQAHIYIANTDILSNTNGNRNQQQDYRRPQDIAANGLRSKFWTDMSSIDGLYRLIEHESFHLEVDSRTGWQKLDDGIQRFGRSIYNLPEIQSLARQGHLSFLIADTPAIIARYAALLTIKGYRAPLRVNGNCPTDAFAALADPRGWSGCRKRDGACGITTGTNDEPETQPSEEEPKKPAPQKPANQDPTNEEPTNEEPTNEEPTNEEPTNENPTSSSPTNENPDTSDPSSEDPSNEDPTNENPSSGEGTGEGTGTSKPAPKPVRPPKA